MSIEITPDFVKSALNTRHPNSTECEQLAAKIEVHAKGTRPDELITRRRPSENNRVQQYRMDIYVPITKKPVSKVFNSLSKIRRSQDWNIQYDAESVSKKIKEEETLEYYCEKKYPIFTSITNWAFNELLKRYLIDANSVCAVIIKNLPDSASDYVKPEVEIFSSKQIINFENGSYYILQSADVTTKESGKSIIKEGKIYYVITDTQIARFEDIPGYGLTMKFIYDHNFNEIPVFKVGGVYFDRKNNEIIQESRISPMIPFLDEAVREYSDLQAEIVQHIFSEKIIYTNTECPSCFGKPIIDKENPGKTKVCNKCNGTGHVAMLTPYGEYHVSVGKQNIDSPLPQPAIEFVKKSTEIAKLQDERVRNHTYDALSAINMEFLAETPLNQSGTAKEVDRDELNTFVNSIAEDIVMVLDNVYYFICHYRYSFLIQDKKEREKMLPVIPVPEKFDLLNTSVLVNDIQTAKNASINPMLIKHMEIELARKKYNAEPNVAYEVECMFELDTLYGYSQNDKMTMLANAGITAKDYVISCNISQFVQRAFKDYQDFMLKSFSDRKTIIAGYAEEVIKENSIKEILKEELDKMLNPTNE